MVPEEVSLPNGTSLPHLTQQKTLLHIPSAKEFQEGKEKSIFCYGLNLVDHSTTGGENCSSRLAFHKGIITWPEARGECSLMEVVNGVIRSHPHAIHVLVLIFV